MNKILIIHTGGTFSMEQDEKGLLTPGSYAFEYINTMIKPLFQAEIDQVQLCNIDSSLFTPQNWIEIANKISEEYDNYSSFVVIHGTDTMAYTASALSFFLTNLNKPVILTGSQLPLNKKRSDAMQNLITAIEVAEKSSLKEVAVVFNHTVFRGNRVKKKDAWDFDAFYSPNYPPLIKLGIGMEEFKHRFKQNSSGIFELDTRIDSSVINIPFFPGLDFNTLLPIVSEKKIKGMVIEAYGSGNIPSDNPGLEKLFKEAAKNEIPIAVCSQSPIGKVNLKLYKVASKADFYGLISSVDMTREATLVKLMVALGRYDNLNKIKKFMQINICGEKENSNVR